jgi:hypothetical protein
MVNSSLFRRIELQLLMNLTARALGQRPKRLWTLSNDNALQAYAEYTRRHLQTGADKPLLQRMNDEAYRTGSRLRRLFLIRNSAAAERLIMALYRNIGINLTFSDHQQLCFHHCYFSTHYTPAVCLAASALDDGIIRGITGRSDRHLCFSQRITEGCHCCKATLQPQNKNR